MAVSITWSSWDSLDPRTPVVIGVGVACPEPGPPGEGDDALDLMVTAARRAGADCGAPGLLSTVDVVSVPTGSWSRRNPGGYVAAHLGARGARSVSIDAGIPQQTLFDDAYRAILTGDADVALIVGGEAARRTATAKRAGVELPEPDGAGDPDERRSPEGEIVSDLEIEAGLWAPPTQYALIDSALRHAEGRSIEEHRDEIAALWAGFNVVASRFEHAAFGEPRSVEFLRDPSPENRLVASPYNKWHCAQMAVDQAAAILITSLAAARDGGVNPSKVVFPLVALESSASTAVLRRRDLHRWPAMRVLSDAAVAHLGAPLGEIDHAEIYSCFPAAVRVQQRELGLPLDGVPTITGGESFAGGPWNNFVLQATAAMVERLRTDRGSRGLVSTVSGFLNKPGLTVYSTDPLEHGLLLADLAADAAAATVTLPVARDYRGAASIAAVTVTEDRDGARRVVALVDTVDGERWIAFNDSPTACDRALTDELIGTAVEVDGFSFTYAGRARS